MKLLLVFVALVAPSLGARLPYIVGGQDVDEPGKWPWQASLQQHNSHICGAAIISDTWLVTAAHCVESAAFTMTVVLGMHDRVSMNMGDPQRYKIQRIIQHERWSMDPEQGFPNDIALIELANPAKLNGDYVQAIKLAEPYADWTENDDCWITGWGKMGFLKPPPNILQEAHVNIYTKDQCQEKHGDIIQCNHICVGKHRVSGSCSGDSGGPLVCKEGDSYTLAGVTSWGLITCSTEFPSVYTRMSFYRDWIKRTSGV